ncbi:cytochrome P450 [Aeromicrobium sp. Root236]|uniref:cytochrome P450 n=1 Tax=Aeromicrobium sp. Root236 TaxID=1736498 RepID=UPI0006FF8456|nr:cytochrome P450 [Aeromicrobium sp. Root236]KRC65637.1 cytochrome P450 [Aeromicrobium sp. Root236]
MTTPEATTDVSTAPLAPDVPMGFRERLRTVQQFHTGPGRFRDAGGPVTMVRLGPRRLVPAFAVVTSPEGAHDVLAASDGAFDKEMIVHVQNRTFGDNLFNLPHERWKPRRRTIQPVFTKKQVSTYAGHMAVAAQATATALTSAGAVDLDVEMRHMTLQVLGRSVLGLDLGERAEELGPPVNRMLRWNTSRSLRPVRAPLWLPTPARWRFRQALKAVHGVVDDAIDHAAESEDSGLIRLLQEAVDPVTGKPLSRAQIRDELIVFIIAGHDTTATTLSYTLWALGRDQALQDRVATEISSLGNRPLTIDDVSHLPLTVQVLHEALRLCPPAPAFGRLAMREVVVGGFRIPAGTNVVVGAYALHRDPALWDDPERFDPDRFSPERSAGRSRWQFLPFGAGPRSCVGDHFAMLEATLGVATIMRAARIEALDDDFPVSLPFTMTAGGPIRAQVTAR